MSEVKILDIGCGKNKVKDAIGMDIVNLDGVDIIHSFLDVPYPFESGEFDKVVMQHVLEHVPRYNQMNIKVIDEVYRVLKKGWDF